MEGRNDCRSARPKTQTVGPGRSSRARDYLSQGRDFTLPCKNRGYHHYGNVVARFPYWSNGAGNVGKTEGRSCDHFRSGKAITITYSKSVNVALGVHDAMPMRHIIVYDLPRSTIVSHIIS
jgi:hypothetical protein